MPLLSCFLAEAISFVSLPLLQEEGQPTGLWAVTQEDLKYETLRAL